MKASAPGKIILFGEHAVVYGLPALAAPVAQARAEVDVSSSARPGIWIEAPGLALHAELNTLATDHPLALAIRNLFFALAIDPFPDLAIKITSTIPIASGLGSGASISVALLRALSATVGRSLSNEEVNRHAYEIEKVHHGTPSGIDNTVITYEKPVYFVKGQPMELLNVGQSFAIVIGDTGFSAPTKDSVADVRRLVEAQPTLWNKRFNEVGRLTQTARVAIENGEWWRLGDLMNQNHALLQQMTVSSPELDRLVEAARCAGALGAKLSGGGRGGSMIALVGPEVESSHSAAHEVEMALKRAGAAGTIRTLVSS